MSQEKSNYYSSSEGDWPEPLSKYTLDEYINKRLHKDPEKPVFAFVGEKELTYAELEQRIIALREALRLRGVQKGDRIAILSENSPNWGTTYMAVGSYGAVNIPILPDFHKAEVHHILKNSNAKVLFISGKLLHKIDDTDFKNLEYIIDLSDSSLESDLKIPVENFSDVLENPKPRKKPKAKVLNKPIEIQPEDLLEVLYTSGTTGHSKGVMLTHFNIISNCFSALKIVPINENDKLLSILPMAHSYECTCGLLAGFYNGSSTYYIKGLPTAQTLLPALKKIKPTIMLSVPMIMDKIYKKKVMGEINAKSYSKALYKMRLTRKLVHRIAGKKLAEAFGGNLKAIVFGGAAMPPDVEEFLLDSDFPFVTGYGLSESAPLLTVNPVGRQRLSSCGVTVPDVQVKIMDADPETGIGEIVAKGPNIMQGYFNNEEATKSTFTDDGWLITGDRGYFDDEYLYIKGRSKNLIVGPSGENIFPEQIEYHLSQNQFVLESLVYEKERRIVARVFLDYDALDKEFGTSRMEEGEASRIIQKTLEELRIEANRKMASYSRIHRVIEQQEEFIKTPTKKIKRYLYIN